MDIIDVLVQGTIKATGLILDSRGIDPLAHVGPLTDATKIVLKENLSAIMAEWKNAVEAPIGDAWIVQMLNLQCNELALKVIGRIGL